MNLYKDIEILFSKKEKKKILLLFFGIIIMGLIEVAGVASIAPFMAVVSNPDIIQENEYLSILYSYFNFDSSNSFLLSLGILVLSLLVISNAYTAFITWQITYFVKMQNHHLSMKLLKSYLMQPYLFFLNRNTADLGKNILVEVGRSIEGVILPIMLTLSKCIVTICILIFLIFVDPALALAILLVLGGAYLVIFKLVKNRLANIGKRTVAMILARFKIANEAMSGIKDLKLSNNESEFIRRFEEPSENLAQFSAQSSLISTLPRYALEAIAFGGIVSIVIYLILIGKQGSEVVPIISLYALAGYRLMPALQQIYAGITGAKYNYPALKTLVEDLRSLSTSEEIDNDNTVEINLIEKIEVKSLSFSYPKGDNILKDFNLKIDANTTVGFVGSTGSGKTTLVDLLLGLLMSNNGSITVDNKNITSSNLRSWQKNLGYIPQIIYLSDDTLTNNIAFGVPLHEMDFEKIKQAAKWAQLDNFITSLPEGYDTVVGERGVRLSGGQRQRIGIARALYHDPQVLIMDEATSALDRITENVIIETIKNFSHKKTIIMVAHRLATIKECDIIHIIDKGNIVDSGSYDSLIEGNLVFRELAET